MNPGDTNHARRDAGEWRPLNEGRDVNPGDTARRPQPQTRRAPPLNEGRDVNPGDTPARAGVARAAAALNEGRDVNPGDTGDVVSVNLGTDLAQRRPGRESRRHAPPVTVTSGADVAQRRPGRESRRHESPSVNEGALSGALNEGRDVNPGDTQIADQDLCRELRSTKAGT